MNASSSSNDGHACTPDKLKINLNVATSGFDGTTCWVHARAAAIPQTRETSPVAVMTMQKLLLSGSDVFFGLAMTISTDGLKTWSTATDVDSLRRWTDINGDACICDFTPKWHSTTAKVLGTGHVARYIGDKLMPPPRTRSTAYAVFDPETMKWSKPATLDMPGELGFSAGAGSTQRFDLSDGDILLPIYCRTQEMCRQNGPFSTHVLQCGFDGHRMSIKRIGRPITLDIKRGLYEPSITSFAGRFFLTLRNDDAGYVTASEDGLNFDTPVKWKFDDGSDLGNYNTQQHWLRCANGLYLVYTRRGLNNDNVFRHRAPLLIGRVDPDNLTVIRDTEQVVVPQRGARLGNFGVTEISDNESWVTAAEWMQSHLPSANGQNPCTQFGSDNSVFVATVRR